MPAALKRTSTPGVYARGSRWVAVYLEDGRPRRRSAPTVRAAREIKVRATAREAARRAGPTLHSYALEWVDHYAGRGAHDVINDRTRREYRRLLINLRHDLLRAGGAATRYRRASRSWVRGLAVPPGRREWA